MRDARHGRIVPRLPLEQATERWGAPYGVVHRADLQRVLAEAAGREASAITLIFDAVFNSFRYRGQGLVLVLAAAGDAAKSPPTSSSAPMGCGPRSPTAIGRTTPPRFAGRWAWRAVLAAEEVAGPALATATGLWLGPGAPSRPLPGPIGPGV